MTLALKAIVHPVLAWLVVSPAAIAAAQAGSAAPQPSSSTSPDARSDAAYVRMMQWHGQRGVELSEIALGRASAPELRLVVERFIADQQRDLEDLQRVRQSLGRGVERGAETIEAAEDDPDTVGMIERLRTTQPAAFDALFLSTLIAHQDMGVQLSRNPARFESADVRAFAKRYLQRYAVSLKQLRVMQRGS